MLTSRVERTTTYVVLAAFSFLAFFPVLTIIFLAFHRKSDLVTGFAWPTTVDLGTFRFERLETPKTACAGAFSA